MKKPKFNIINFSSIQFPTMLPLITPFELLTILYIPVKIFYVRFRRDFKLFAVIFFMFLSLHVVSGISNVSDWNFVWFTMKYFSILLCFLTFFVISQRHALESLVALKLSILLTVIFGIFSAPAYIFDYQSLLPFGICETNNIFLLSGHLRCSTFGEGNYLGIFLTTILIIFHTKKSVFFLCLVGIIISMSKIALVILCYLLIRKFLRLPLFGVFIGAIAFLLFFVDADFVGSVLLGNELPERSSAGERLEFARIGLRMFLDNPVIGVGAGQYHVYLSDYTKFPHLLEGVSIPGLRFIPNNVFAEILAEFGTLGIFIYFGWNYLLATHVSKWNRMSVGENIGLLFLLGLAQPTYFILSNFLVYGIAMGKTRDV
jgi:O-antigen ligase